MTELAPEQIDHFITDGYIRIENAFPAEIADECRAILWKATQCDPARPDTWKQPVIRVGELGLEPFRKAANTPVLHQAFDHLAGKDNWVPRETLGSFPIRFPTKESSNDTGWHVDASFPGDDVNNYMSWRINVSSKGRALLMLFLFSEVTENDAPTVLRVGSHADVAKILAPFGDKGLSFMELAEKLNSLPKRKELPATGKAGTVYLCHPFMAHAAQNHRGTSPKFMAQPALLTKKDFDLNKSKIELCAVEKAIFEAIQ